MRQLLQTSHDTTLKMKLLKTFLIFITSFELISCHNTQNVKVISKFANGNVQETHTYRSSSDTLSFLDTRYHENGKILYQGHFENGKRDGPWVWFFSNGVVHDSATYHNGEFTARRVHWDSLGRLTKVELIDGPCYGCCCDGIVISYYPNGKPESEAHMYNGKEQGKYVYYYDNGQPKKEEYFDQDKEKAIITNGIQTPKNG